MNDFNDKLLDASLKEYSRVSPPDGFVVQQAERRERTHWLKLFAPVAATAMVIALVSIHTERPVRRPRPPLPIRDVIDVKAAPLPQTLDLRPLPNVSRTAAAPEAAAQGSRFHTLTAIEMAKLDLPAELFEPRVEQPITDLQITELVVTPLEITDSMPKPKE